MSFEIKEPLPYCPGCGHYLVAKATAKAFEKLGWNPKDVILVTDIGCVGLLDKHLPCHTIHGLHGRAVALGIGIRFGLDNPNKHIVVYQGDGGATIGLQHLMEGARLNVDINVIVHNNMLYGMTGGQSSGLTPQGYKTTTEPQGSSTGGYDLPQLVYRAGASYSSRILVQGDISDDLVDAFAHSGFSLVEAVEYCVSYGRKYNPKEKLSGILKKMGRSVGSWVNKGANSYRPTVREKSVSLLDEVPVIMKRHQHSVSEQLPVFIGGSAGEGVQTAATILARAGMLAGLEVSKKGEFPVTVGSGFSNAELILSPEPIQFTGIAHPQVVIISSKEGLNKNNEIIENMRGGTLVIDKSLPLPSTDARVRVLTGNFREVAGSRGATICAVAFWLECLGLIPREALIEAAEMSKHAELLKVAMNSTKKLGGAHSTCTRRATSG